MAFNGGRCTRPFGADAAGLQILEFLVDLFARRTRAERMVQSRGIAAQCWWLDQAEFFNGVALFEQLCNRSINSCAAKGIDIKALHD